MKYVPKILAVLVVMLFLILGLWLVVVGPFGPHFDLIPGSSADPRLNNYILEHFSRWVSGLDREFWTPSFYYPYQDTLAFGDNLLGSAPVYAVLRGAGLDRETAFQGWYVLGYVLNFLAAAYVLARWRLAPLAIGVGAFFFAFGLPLLAQETHAQLLYRFCVPLACFFLWEMTQRANLYDLLAVIFFAVWQFYLGIYTGIFLFLLLAASVIVLPFLTPLRRPRQFLAFWPRRIQATWFAASTLERLIVSSSVFFLGASLAGLLWPYYQVSKIYTFSRSWAEVTRLLPGWRSYLLADRSWIWKPLSSLFSGVPLRGEHQLFPGGAALVLAVIGFAWAGYVRRSALALSSFAVIIMLVLLTFSFRGFSLYSIVWSLPGMNSIRAVTRIMLVLMWPLAVLIAFGCDVLVRNRNHFALFLIAVAYVLAGVLVVESVLFDHLVFSKSEARARLAALRGQIPAALPSQPILAVGNDRKGPILTTETDAMLLAQELGWPTLNGYTGNLPPGYGPMYDCISMPGRIAAYMSFRNLTSTDFYFQMLRRVVPIGFRHCDPASWPGVPPPGTSSKPSP